MHKEIQPLRVYPDWKVTYNFFFEEQITKENIHEYPGPTLLHLESRHRNQFIDVSWTSEGDINGAYILEMYNTKEVFNPNNNTCELDIDQEPHTVFKSKLKQEIVDKIEELMWFSKVHRDPRILKNRGEVDEPSESYRIKLEKHGLTQELLTKILEDGNKQIQALVLDHKNVTKEIITLFLVDGCSKKVKNKAKEKLKNKKFK